MESAFSERGNSETYMEPALRNRPIDTGVSLYLEIGRAFNTDL